MPAGPRRPRTLGYWETWNVPALGRYDGMVWFRARVKLDKAQAKQAAKLSLGLVDDVDVTWVNGRAVGNAYGDAQRLYDLPPKLLQGRRQSRRRQRARLLGQRRHVRSGRANARCCWPTARAFRLTGWEYQVAPPGLWPPHAPWESLAGVSMLYNAMIAPLGKYGLRGVAWYQGEANAGLDDARSYQALLAALDGGLAPAVRRAVAVPVVQLANFGTLVETPVDSGWAQLRDAQRRAVAADGNAGLAVTIDIGNRDDIHPTNKQDVGKRLARAARHVVYGEKISAPARNRFRRDA